MNKHLDNLGAVVFRNRYGLMNIPSEVGKVNVEAYPIQNVGDTLGPVIVDWILKQKNIDAQRSIGQTRHLLTVGSVVSFGRFDATVWGSGILNENAYGQIVRKSKLYRRKLDIRAVRGPLTREALLKAGYFCPEIYGDPAVLLPFIYSSNCQEKKYRVSVILHHESSILNEQQKDEKKHYIRIENKTIVKNGMHIIDPVTNDYRQFINEITASNFVISSSLHGLIIAESYGIPAVFLNLGVEHQNTKFMDWYKSTKRDCTFSRSIEEALQAQQPPLPDLEKIREQLIDCFPYDLWQ